MKENLSYLFTYTKKLRKRSNKIGLLTDDKNRVIDRPVPDILQDHYSSVWSIPSENYKVNDLKFFKTSVELWREKNTGVR